MIIIEELKGPLNEGPVAFGVTWRNKSCIIGQVQPAAAAAPDVEH